MEIRHKQSVISFLLLALDSAEFLLTCFYGTKREHSGLSSIFTKKETRSDYKIIQKCEHYLMSSMTPLLLHIPLRPSEHTHYIQLRRKAFNKLPAREQPGQGSRHAQSVGSEQSRHHHIGNNNPAEI